MITRSGYLVLQDVGNETKKELTVRPNADTFGTQGQSFKVFKQSRGHLCIPRYYGISRFGEHIRDTRNPPVGIFPQFNATLRTHQIEPRNKGIDQLTKLGGGVLSLPCGFGKTITSLSIACHFKVRTMIMVHKEFLANQWREVITKICPGSTIGLVQGDSIDIEKDFVICMIQTLVSRDYEFGTFDSIGMLIVDECHHICARAFSQTMFKLCPKYTLGLSATPERKDGLTNILYWFLGPLFYSINRESEDVQVIPIYYEGPFSEIRYTRFGKLSLSQMITDLTLLDGRNEVLFKLVDSLLDTGRHILLLTDRREHACMIHEKYKEVSGLYIGGMKEEDLSQSSKKKLVIATFSLAQEGLDIPDLDTAIFATPKSDVVQASGRILRGSTHPVIYDLVDKWSIFFGMYKKRCKIYESMKFSVPNISPTIQWLETKSQS